MTCSSRLPGPAVPYSRLPWSSPRPLPPALIAEAGGWRQYDITRAGGPEQVDHGPATSPSKRLGKVDPNYIKTVTGPLLIAEAGLGAILNRCPTFAAWWQDLLS